MNIRLRGLKRIFLESLRSRRDKGRKSFICVHCMGMLKSIWGLAEIETKTLGSSPYQFQMERSYENYLYLFLILL